MYLTDRNASHRLTGWALFMSVNSLVAGIVTALLNIS